MTKEIISIADCKLELSKDFISDTKKVEIFAKELDGLSKIVLDFSTKEKIKEAKELRTQANKFLKELKEFCEPLEAEGKRISDARSLISTKLNKSKSSIIEALLLPIDEREEKIKSIKNKLFIPSLDANSNANKLAEIEFLVDYQWFGFKEEATQLIEQHKQFLLNEKIKFDEEEKIKKEAEEKARLDRENQIRLEAESKAKAEAELKLKQETERLEREKEAAIKAEQDKVEKQKNEEERLAKDKGHRAKIHNAILSDLNKFISDEELSKNIIKAIVEGEISNLKIVY